MGGGMVPSLALEKKIEKVVFTIKDKDFLAGGMAQMVDFLLGPGFNP
jgi:hypothetical protein